MDKVTKSQGIEPNPKSLSLAVRAVEYGRSRKVKRLYKSLYGRSDARLKDVPENPIRRSYPTTDRKRVSEGPCSCWDCRPTHTLGEGEALSSLSWSRLPFVTFIMDAGATVKEGELWLVIRHLRVNDERLRKNKGAMRLSSLVDTIGNTVSRAQKPCHTLSLGRRHKERRTIPNHPSIAITCMIQNRYTSLTETIQFPTLSNTCFEKQIEEKNRFRQNLNRNQTLHCTPSVLYACTRLKHLRTCCWW